MADKTLPRLEEIELVDGPHAGQIWHVAVGMMSFNVYHADRPAIATYQRRFEKTAEGRIAFMHASSSPST
jgi:hypothetical protein